MTRHVTSISYSRGTNYYQSINEQPAKGDKIVMVNSQIYIPPKDLFLLIRFTAKLHPVNLTIIKTDRGSRK